MYTDSMEYVQGNSEIFYIYELSKPFEHLQKNSAKYNGLNPELTMCFDECAELLQEKKNSNCAKKSSKQLSAPTKANYFVGIFWPVYWKFCDRCDCLTYCKSTIFLM